MSLITNPPPLLLEELVLSADSVEDVAKRHDVEPDVLKLAIDHPLFSTRLAAAKAHHEKTGEFQRTLARHRFIEALDNAHFKAMDPRTSPRDAIAYMESVASIGEIKRPATQLNAEGGGSGFVFNIHFSGGQTVSVEAKGEPEAIEGEVVNTTTELPVVSLAEPSELGEPTALTLDECVHDPEYEYID